MSSLRDDSILDRSASGSSTVAAYFRDADRAERAINQLTEAGISKNDIGVAVSELDRPSDETPQKKKGIGEKIRSMFSSDEREEYDSGNDLDVLHHMGLKDADATYYRSAISAGGVLVTVNAGSRFAEVQSILQAAGGELPGEQGAAQSAGFRGANVEQNRTATGTQRIQLLGEVLRVQKERVKTASVNLRKDVVSERQDVDVPVTREELIIERHPVQGREAVAGNFEPGKQVRIDLEEERVRVEKQPVVREEVEVGKRQVQRTQHVSENVRRENLEVDREGQIESSSDSRDPKIPRRRAS